MASRTSPIRLLPALIACLSFTCAVTRLPGRETAHVDGQGVPLAYVDIVFDIHMPRALSTEITAVHSCMLDTVVVTPLGDILAQRGVVLERVSRHTGGYSRAGRITVTVQWRLPVRTICPPSAGPCLSTQFGPQKPAGTYDNVEIATTYELDSVAFAILDERYSLPRRQFGFTERFDVPGVFNALLSPAPLAAAIEQHCAMVFDAALLAIGKQEVPVAPALYHLLTGERVFECCWDEGGFFE